MLSPFRKEVKLMILNRLSTLGIITFGMLSFAANSAQQISNSQAKSMA